MEKKLEKLDHLESCVKSVDKKIKDIKEINAKVDRFETTRVLVNAMDKGMAILKGEVESLKQTLYWSTGRRGVKCVVNERLAQTDFDVI